MRLFLSIILISIFSYALEFEHIFEHIIENTNILKYNKKQVDDYNRARAYLTFQDNEYENSIVKLIVDNENIYNYKTNSSDNKSSIYRAYFKYTNDKHLLSMGLQRVPLGVGSIWNPLDIFNPIDSTTIEPNHREGVESLRYEYAINSLSNLDIAFSKDKSSLKIKSYLDFADFALIVLHNDKLNQTILGYEVQGDLYETGVELKSEGGYFKDKELNENFISYIIGAQYGFENSLILSSEYYTNTKTNLKNLGITLSYTISSVININLLNISNIKDNSYLISPTLEYSLADDIVLSYSYFNYNSKNNHSQFSNFSDTHFLKISISL